MRGKGEEGKIRKKDKITFGVSTPTMKSSSSSVLDVLIPKILNVNIREKLKE